MVVLPRPRHPRTRDRFRSLLALWSLPELLLAFVVLLGIVGALLGLGFRLSADGSEHSYGFWFRESLLMLAGLTTTTTQEDQYGWHAVYQLVGAIGGVMLPALVLGTVVFKAFVKDRVFVTRAKMALLRPEQVENLPTEDVARWLAFRIYSSTKLQLVNLRFEAYARVKGRSPTGSRTVTNAKLQLHKDRWPVALTHVPYTLYTPLRAEDTEEADGSTRLVSVRTIDGRTYALDQGCDILVVVTGSLPELGTDLIESHWFRADDDLSAQPFGEIEVDYPADRKTWRASKNWGNWQGFDEPT